MKQAAIIDVGSHSIRYAVGRVQDGQARMEPKRLESTHLAEGVSKTGRLGEVPMMRPYGPSRPLRGMRRSGAYQFTPMPPAPCGIAKTGLIFASGQRP